MTNSIHVHKPMVTHILAKHELLSVALFRIFTNNGITVYNAVWQMNRLSPQHLCYFTDFLLLTQHANLVLCDA